MSEEKSIRGDRSDESVYHQSSSEAEKETLDEQVVHATNADNLKRAVPISIGKFQLIRMLGAGAMGVVYLALDTQLGRHVALKVPTFTGKNTTGQKIRFIREARSAARLKHPNICPVYEFGEHDGIPYIAMAFVDGTPLISLISSKNPRSEREAATIVRKIAKALAAAHAAGVIHRDLKPTNIMIDKSAEPIVTDFGLAGIIDQEQDDRLTHTGAILGTPAYMAPEQAEGEIWAIGPHSDIYSLGVILYELLTGKVPFGGSVSRLLSEKRSTTPRLPSELRNHLSASLERICLRMLEREIKDRYESMQEVADDLTSFLEGIEIRSRETDVERRINLRALDDQSHARLPVIKLTRKPNSPREHQYRRQKKPTTDDNESQKATFTIRLELNRIVQIALVLVLLTIIVMSFNL